jgi:anthranilate synthase/aminodeoxychorismate synthase-like glutamine amidotransferase
MAGRIPVLGVCLGHQVICELYGGRVDRAARIVHGKPDEVTHDGSALYGGLPSPFEAGRYHSLAALAPIPDELVVTAHTPDGEVMGVRHRTDPTHGVQFHPESVLTPHGRRLIENFLAMEAGR